MAWPPAGLPSDDQITAMFGLERVPPVSRYVDGALTFSAITEGTTLNLEERLHRGMPWLSGPDHDQAEAARATVGELLARLPHTDADILRARMAGRTRYAIADDLGLDPTTVRDREHRARRRMAVARSLPDLPLEQIVGDVIAALSTHPVTASWPTWRREAAAAVAASLYWVPCPVAVGHALGSRHGATSGWLALVRDALPSEHPWHVVDRHWPAHGRGQPAWRGPLGGRGHRVAEVLGVLTRAAAPAWPPVLDLPRVLPPAERRARPRRRQMDLPWQGHAARAIRTP